MFNKTTEILCNCLTSEYNAKVNKNRFVVKYEELFCLAQFFCYFHLLFYRWLKNNVYGFGPKSVCYQIWTTIRFMYCLLYATRDHKNYKDLNCYQYFLYVLVRTMHGLLPQHSLLNLLIVLVKFPSICRAHCTFIILCDKASTKTLVSHIACARSFSFSLHHNVVSKFAHVQRLVKVT